MDLEQQNTDTPAADPGASDSLAAALAGTPPPTPPPAASGTDTPAIDPASPVAAEQFLAQFSADTPEGEKTSLRDWVASVGVKDLEGLAKIARDNQRAARDSGRVKVPGENATEEEKAAWRQAIGVPEKPEDYATPEFKNEAGEPIELNSALIDRIKASAHKIGMGKTELETLLQEEIQAQIAEADGMRIELDKRADSWIKANWKENAAEQLDRVDAAAKWLGFDRNDMLALRGALGPEKALEKLAKIGENLKEDTLLRGDVKARFGMTGEQAQAQLTAKQSDRAWIEKATVPGTPENAEYKRLQDIIGADADRKAAAGS